MLPQLASNKIFLTDGGAETTLIFHEGQELPHFAAFDLLKHDAGRKMLTDYYRPYLELARQYGTGFILESATWRASGDWGEKLGYSPAALADANRRAIDMLLDLRQEYSTPATPFVVSGCLGPRGDGYNPASFMTADEAAEYHAPQIESLRAAGAEMIAAFTLTYADEAVGITRAAQAAGLPVAISFTLETDGKLPNGQTLSAAITQADAATGNGPAYYQINCAHPTHFANVLAPGEAWVKRIRGLRANASTRSHAELNDAPDLDIGDPADLGARYRDLRNRIDQLTILGGCCGTDHRHLAAICQACIRS